MNYHFSIVKFFIFKLSYFISRLTYLIKKEAASE
jgi:hypothetical protein